jgi:hypothetical protein
MDRGEKTGARRYSLEVTVGSVQELSTFLEVRISRMQRDPATCRLADLHIPCCDSGIRKRHDGCRRQLAITGREGGPEVLGSTGWKL